MEYVRWDSRPKLRRPVMVAAFEGWNDAAESASSAVDYLGNTWDERVFASIDPEEFYDFTVVRPQVRLIDGVTREIDWRTTRFAATAPPNADGDVVLVHGIEPNNRWRTFCDDVVDIARELDIELVLTLGALAAEVPHTRDVQVTGTGSDPDLIEELGLRRSRYEGPTGIVGVLHTRFAEAGIKSASLWAAVPHYVSQQPSPKATLALARRAADIVGASLETTDLEIAAASYERQVDDMIEADEDIANYVHGLERVIDNGETMDDPDRFDIAAQAERFLREQN
ncbi:MAG TPA: PAC2 family protein [Acidimicrobiales bacterium]|nr:PAC2 family protein [Acidimicrobiales bacterium]